jgi:acetyltransferase-like isoleucine patch superfamily enzyme
MTELVQRALRLVGKDYVAANDLPPALVASVLWQRAVWLARGVIRLRTLTFVGRGVRIRGKRHIALGRAVTLEPGSRIDGFARRGVVIGDRTKIGALTVVSNTGHLSYLGQGVAIGSDCGIGEFGFIGGGGGVVIGDNVIMGQYVSFHSENHQFGDSTALIRLQGGSREGIRVDDNCWIGSRVTFLDGAHLGANSVVAAGAVVRGTFPAHSVIGGVPATVLRSTEPGAAVGARS